MMVVVSIIAIIAAMAAPSMIRVVRDQRTVKEVYSMMNAFREARLRALGRGTAIRADMQNQAKTGNTTQVTVHEAFMVPVAGYEVPNPQCRTTTWYTPNPAVGATGSKQIYHFSQLLDGQPSSQWVGNDQLSGLPIATVDDSICFSPNGRAYSLVAGVWGPPPQTFEYQARRLEAGAPVGLIRAFKVFGNGTVRMADCDPALPAATACH